MRTVTIRRTRTHRTTIHRSRPRWDTVPWQGRDGDIYAGEWKCQREAQLHKDTWSHTQRQKHTADTKRNNHAWRKVSATGTQPLPGHRAWPTRMWPQREVHSDRHSLSHTRTQPGAQGQSHTQRCNLCPRTGPGPGHQRAWAGRVSTRQAPGMPTAGGARRAGLVVPSVPTHWGAAPG